MKALIIHLSDIHIKSDDSGFAECAEKLASSVYSQFRNSDICVFAITGDITFSGKKVEFDIASKFLTNVKDYLGQEKDIEIVFALAPGNHDCDIPIKDSVRDILIKSLVEDPKKAHEEDVVKEVTRVQENFFEFRQSFRSKYESEVDELLSIIEIQYDGFSLNFMIFNASWMSSINEVQGALVFPIDNYKKNLENDSFTVSLLHHPLNWYCQDSYHPFKHSLQINSDIVLSGHEHVAKSYAIDSGKSKSAMYFEAPAFDAKSHAKSFVTIEIDFEKSTVTQAILGELDDCYEIKDNEVFNFSEKSNTSNLNEEFYDYISSVGANLWHPSKKVLTIDDVYVPLVLSSSIRDETVKSYDVDFNGRTILVSGEELSGKTKYLHKVYTNFLSVDIVPVFIDSAVLKRTTLNDFIKCLDKQVKVQYKESSFYERLPKYKRAILIDDIEGFGIDKKGFSDIVKYIRNNFGSIVVSCSENLKMTSMASILQNYFCFDEKLSIKDVSANGRAALIDNWQRCGTNQLVDSKYNHRVEQTINTVLGRNLIPSRPLFLLTLLQSTTPTGNSELTDSGLSYYYQYLITKSLEESGVNRSFFDELFNYLSNLAWYYKINDSDSMEYGQLEEFNRGFSEKFTEVDLDKQLSIFVRAKLLFSDGAEYRFSYPYIKYFFVGKYLADNIERPDISAEINRYCNNLFTSEDSTTILFLTHHRNSEWVIREISRKLSTCYENYDVVRYEDDHSPYLASMVGSVSEIIIEELDVEKNNEARRLAEEARDADREPSDDYFQSGNDGSSTDIQTLYTAIRSAEVLGQITKNYYGSIERTNKRGNIDCIIRAFLRLLNYVFDDLSKNEEDIRSQITDNIRNINKDLSSSELSILSQKIVSSLVSSLSSGIIFKIAHTIYSDKLLDDIKFLSAESVENSYLLVEAAAHLM